MTQSSASHSVLLPQLCLSIATTLLLFSSTAQAVAALNVDDDVRSDILFAQALNPDQLYLQSKGLRGVHKTLLPTKDLLFIVERGRKLIARMDAEDYSDESFVGEANDHSVSAPLPAK